MREKLVAKNTLLQLIKNFKVLTRKTPFKANHENDFLQKSDLSDVIGEIKG